MKKRKNDNIWSGMKGLKLMTCYKGSHVPVDHICRQLYRAQTSRALFSFMGHAGNYVRLDLSTLVSSNNKEHFRD